jgi:hypothetical protein
MGARVGVNAKADVQGCGQRDWPIPQEVDGFVIHQRAKDGYVNATAMCKAAGKLLGNWSQNNDNKKVLASLSPVIGIPITGNLENGERGLVVIRRGGRPDEQGTWVHPQ